MASLPFIGFNNLCSFPIKLAVKTILSPYNIVLAVILSFDKKASLDLVSYIFSSNLKVTI